MKSTFLPCLLTLVTLVMFGCAQPEKVESFWFSETQRKQEATSAFEKNLPFALLYVNGLEYTNISDEKPDFEDAILVSRVDLDQGGNLLVIRFVDPRDYMFDLNIEEILDWLNQSPQLDTLDTSTAREKRFF